MGVAAGFAEGAHFVIEGLPILVEGVGACDDDIYFVGAIFDRLVDFFEALFEGAKSGGESGADGGDGDSGTLEVFDGFGDVGVIDADGSGVELGETEFAEGLGADGLFCFGAESVDVARGVIAAEGGEINAFDSADEVGGLVFFFYGSAFGECVGAPVYGGSVDGEGLHPVEVEGGSGVAVSGYGQV